MKNTRKIQYGTAGFVLLWLLISILLAARGLFNQPSQPPIYFGVFLAVPLSGFMLAYIFNQPFKAAMKALPLWTVTAVHIARFEGYVFVLDAVRGRLPTGFGWQAGMGDVVSAAIAVALTILLRTGRNARGLRAVFLAWNLFGLADLFSAVALGLLYSVSVVGLLATPASNAQLLTSLPLSIIPTFYVPLLILLHFLALTRQREISKTAQRSAMPADTLVASD